MKKIAKIAKISLKNESYKLLFSRDALNARKTRMPITFS